MTDIAAHPFFMWEVKLWKGRDDPGKNDTISILSDIRTGNELFFPASLPSP